ncbi:junction-mediating and -regulatory protein-like, partial [Plakobranchus ocellatus]
IIDQLNIDRNRYGPAAFDLIAGERELRLHQELHAAKVDLLQSKRKQLKQKKDKLVMQIPEEESGRAQSQETKKLIHSKHKLQEKIFGLELDILTEKKWLLHTQIAIRKRELSEASDEQIVFHDAVEDVAELSDEEEEETLDIMRNDEELVKLKLERVKLTQHQSKIRNKQKELAKGLKVRQRQEEEEELRIQRHHQVQMKRDKQKEEENEKSSFIFEERKKTIERLKEYKVKYTAPKTIKPPRYQRPSDTKNRSSKPASTNSKSKVSSRQSTKPAIQTPKTASPQAKKSKFLPKQKTGVDDTKKLQDIPVTIFACEKDLQSKTDLSVPPASPPPPPLPPPPPPPPPPPLLPSSPPVSASGPPKPTNLMEELSQGQNLLKKVDMSTSSKEASGTPGPIDLGSILASRSKLKPASARQERPPLLDRTDPLEDIFSMIRSGVTLRKVSSDPPPGESGQGDPMISSISSSIYSTDARSQLHNTLLNKICRGVRGTTPESDDEFGSENDEFDDD